MFNKFSVSASKLHYLAWGTVLALSLAACGGDDPSSTAATSAVTSATTSAATQPFTLNGVPETSVRAGSTYQYTPSASGSTGRVLAYDIVNKPEWATFVETSGELFGTPDASDVGTTAGVEIGVSDGTGPADRAERGHDRRGAIVDRRRRPILWLYARRIRSQWRRSKLFDSQSTCMGDF